jgi:LPXTG-motif cell wall-anchored protein
MNTVTGMPLIDNPNGFFILVGVMATLGLSMFLYFKRKRWI